MIDFLQLVRDLPFGVLVLRGATLCYANRAAEAIIGFANGIGVALDRLGERARAVDHAVSDFAAQPSPKGLGRRQVAFAGRATIRLHLRHVDDTTAALVLEAGVREVDLMRRFHTELELGAIDARMAVRIVRGMSNAEIAEALRIPIGTVKSRLARLSSRLGVSGRIALTTRLAAEIPLPIRRPAAGPLPSAATVANGDLRYVIELLTDSSLALAAVDGATGKIAWGSRAGGRLRESVGAAPASACRQGVPGIPSTPVAAALEPLLRSEPAGEGLKLDVRVRGTALCGSAWRLGPLVFIEMHHKIPRTDDLKTLFVDTYGLSPRQAEVALLIAHDVKLREIAERLQVADGTIRSMTGTIYDKLGVSDRLDLVGTFSDMLVTGA